MDAPVLKSPTEPPDNAPVVYVPPVAVLVPPVEVVLPPVILFLLMFSSVSTGEMVTALPFKSCWAVLVLVLSPWFNVWSGIQVLAPPQSTELVGKTGSPGKST